MSPSVASIIFAIGIAGLFFLDRGEKSRVSNALWIPTVWLFCCASRSVSEWLGVSPTVTDGAVYLEGSPVDRAVLSILEVVALIVVISRRRRVSPILRRNWAIGLFFSYAALSISWSDYPLVAFKHWIKGIGDVMMVLIVLTEPRVADAIKRLATRLGFVLLPLSVLFIRYYPLLGRRLTLSWTMEPIGVCTQKNGLGELCDVVGLGLLWCFRSVYNDRGNPRRRRRLLALGIVLATIVWLLWMCNSLTSICALSMASIVMLLSTRLAVRRNPALVHLLTVAVLAISVYALFFQDSGALITSLGRDPTMSGRRVGWPIILSVASNSLVGAGYESFWLGPRLRKVWELIPGAQVGEAHNGYIEIYLILGWIGVGLLGVLIATGYRNVIGGYRRDPATGSLRIAFFIAPLVTGLTEAAFRMMAPPWIIFLLATADAPWAAQRRMSAARTAAEDLLESGQESDVDHEEAPVEPLDSRALYNREPLGEGYRRGVYMRTLLCAHDGLRDYTNKPRRVLDRKRESRNRTTTYEALTYFAVGAGL
jgi:O-antigen ligase